MMFISNVFVALAVLAVTQAAPLNKRIAQTIADSTVKWEQACVCPTFRNIVYILTSALY